MGICCSMRFEQKTVVLPIRPPKLFYLSQQRNRLFCIEGGKFKKLKLPKIKINKNCAIGYLNDGSILVAGGVRNDGRLSREVFHINPTLLSISEYPSLTKANAKGSIFQVGLYIYFISRDLTQPHQRLVNRRWEVIFCNEIDLHSASIMLQEQIFYFLCGIKPNGKPTKKLYSINLSTSNEYQCMKHKLNFKIMNPIAYSAYDFVIVVGGYKTNKLSNTSIYIQNDWEWKEFAGPDVELEDYPCLYSNRTCFFIGKSRKLVQVTSQAKISVLSDPNYKKKPLRSSTLCPMPKPKLRKYRKNSVFLQNSLNNLLPLYSNCINSQDNIQFGDSSLSDSDQENTTSFQTLSPTARVENSLLPFSITLQNR